MYIQRKLPDVYFKKEFVFLLSKFQSLTHKLGWLNIVLKKNILKR